MYMDEESIKISIAGIAIFGFLGFYRNKLFKIDD